MANEEPNGTSRQRQRHTAMTNGRKIEACVFSLFQILPFFTVRLHDGRKPCCLFRWCPSAGAYGRCFWAPVRRLSIWSSCLFSPATVRSQVKHRSIWKDSWVHYYVTVMDERANVVGLVIFHSYGSHFFGSGWKNTARARKYKPNIPIRTQQ